MVKIEENINNLDIFIEYIPDLVFIKDINGKYKNCNEIFLNFINKKRDEVIGKTDFEIFTKENAQKFREIDEKILKIEKKELIEERFIHENGSISYFNTTKEPLYNNNKQVGLFCVTKNITQEKEYKIIYDDNKSMLEYIAIENNLSKILDKIVGLAEERNPKTQCSILILDKKRSIFLKALHHHCQSFTIML